MAVTQTKLVKASETLGRLVADAPSGSLDAELARLTKAVVDEAVKANRRAIALQKELRLPQGTIVISPDTGTYGVIGKDGMVDPRTVRPLTAQARDAVGGLFYSPSSRPVGSDGSGQSLIGPGFVGKGEDRHGIGAAVAAARTNVARGRVSVGAVVEAAQESVRKGVCT